MKAPTRTSRFSDFQSQMRCELETSQTAENPPNFIHEIKTIAYDVTDVNVRTHARTHDVNVRTLMRFLRKTG